MARIPVAAGYKVLKNTDIRVSKEASAALREYMEERVLALGERAARIAKHSGRKTILASDVLFALEHDKK